MLRSCSWVKMLSRRLFELRWLVFRHQTLVMTMPLFSQNINYGSQAIKASNTISPVFTSPVNYGSFSQKCFLDGPVLNFLKAISYTSKCLRNIFSFSFARTVSQAVIKVAMNFEWSWKWKTEKNAIEFLFKLLLLGFLKLYHSLIFYKVGK